MPAETKTVRFVRTKETENMIVFKEQPEPGTAPIIGRLYIAKWYVGSATTVRVAITKE